jgi:two-component system response regulator VicR
MSSVERFRTKGGREMSETPSLIVITPAIAIDRAQQIVLRYQRPVFLPARTWHLLAYLVDHPQRLIPDATLLRVGWPHEEWHVPSDLYRHMHRIRGAIEPDPRHPQVLLTRRDVGYVLVLPSGVDTQRPSSH